MVEVKYITHSLRESEGVHKASEIGEFSVYYAEFSG